MGKDSDSSNFCCDWHSNYYFKTGQVWKCEEYPVLDYIFVSNELADKLRKKGFKEDSFKEHPTYVQVIDWLAEHKGIFISIVCEYKDTFDYGWKFIINKEDSIPIEDGFLYKTYIQALKRAFGEINI